MFMYMYMYVYIYEYLCINMYVCMQCMESLMSTMGDGEIQEAAGMYICIYMSIYVSMYIYVCGVWRVHHGR
jgi:hypothetical protein